MSIVMKEYVNFESFTVKDAKNEMSIKESVNLNLISDDSIMADIEVLHDGVGTRNFTRYFESAFKSSKESWTNPYAKPIILHHNEDDGTIIGRTLNAETTDSTIVKGKKCLLITGNISEKEAVKAVLDGRLNTVSVGVILHDVRCSICGQQLAHGEDCEHQRGNMYDNKICYWDIYDMEAKELSYVIVPSNQYAQNINIYSPRKGNKAITESINNDEVKKMESTELNSKIVELQESIVKKDECINTIQAESITLKESIQDLTEKNKDLETKLNMEKQLREAAESELISFKEKQKEHIVNEIISVRESLKLRQISKESLMERSEDSLKDALEDLRLEASEKAIEETSEPVVEEGVEVKKESKEEVKVEEIKDSKESLNNPGLVELKEKTDSEKLKNMNLTEEFDKIIKNLYN